MPIKIFKEKIFALTISPFGTFYGKTYPLIFQVYLNQINSKKYHNKHILTENHPQKLKN